MRRNIIELRKKRHLNQNDVARALGISRSFYAMIELGQRNPTLSLAKQIAEYFGTQVDELFFSSDGSRNETPTARDSA